MSLRALLTWNQKYEILRECQRRGITKRSIKIQSVGEWAVQHFHLQKQPWKRTLQWVLENKQQIVQKIEQGHADQKKNVNVTSEAIELYCTCVTGFSRCGTNEYFYVIKSFKKRHVESNAYSMRLYPCTKGHTRSIIMNGLTHLNRETISNVTRRTERVAMQTMMQLWLTFERWGD